MPTYAYRQAAGIRQALLDRRELANRYVREEADFATAPTAVCRQCCLSKPELEVRRRIPRFTTRSPSDAARSGGDAVERPRPGSDAPAERAAKHGGGELFRDVNSASNRLASWWKACVTTVAQRPGGSGAHRQPAR
ncbi:hypothetical protein LNP25_26860 [Klebsiella variicola subsp. variicola]|nr:hypothetical protein [Klebsiella variicola subsp. variicola]